MGELQDQLSFQPSAAQGSLRYVQDASASSTLQGRDSQGRVAHVMMAWERPYMHALVEELGVTPACSVLEVGFGLGLSAAAIQRCQPRSHTIVECDDTVLRAARAWRGEHAGRDIRVVEGTWQATLAGLGTFDRVFFDDFPLGSTCACVRARCVTPPQRGSKRRTSWPRDAAGVGSTPSWTSSSTTTLAR